MKRRFSLHEAAFRLEQTEMRKMCEKGEHLKGKPSRHNKLLEICDTVMSNNPLAATLNVLGAFAISHTSVRIWDNETSA